MFTCVRGYYVDNMYKYTSKELPKHVAKLAWTKYVTLYASRMVAFSQTITRNLNHVTYSNSKVHAYMSYIQFL